MSVAQGRTNTVGPFSSSAAATVVRIRIAIVVIIRVIFIVVVVVVGGGGGGGEKEGSFFKPGSFLLLEFIQPLKIAYTYVKYIQQLNY